MNFNTCEMPHNKEEESYQQYLRLGGIINEQDCKSALERAQSATTFNKTFKGHAKDIARIANIELHNIEKEDILDPRVKLYVTLREDDKPEGSQNHHGQMGDKQLFVEALRMMGDTESVDKMIKAFPHIFKKNIPNKEIPEKAI